MRTSSLVAALAALFLAACDGDFNLTRNAPAAIALPDGLIIAGARGWCIDPATPRTRGEAAVVVLGSCAANAGNALWPRAPVQGIVTIAVEEPAADAPPAEALEAYLATENGRAALARNGRADSLDILETRRRDDTLFLHAIDRSGWPRDTAEDYWRALFDIDGRFVTVSLVGAADASISRDAGLATLQAQIDRLKAANGG